jgi:hypothetical protein
LVWSATEPDPLDRTSHPWKPLVSFPGLLPDPVIAAQRARPNAHSYTVARVGAQRRQFVDAGDAPAIERSF